MCKEKGMDLASLETMEENNCIKNEIEKAGIFLFPCSCV